MDSDVILDALNFALAGAREGFGPFLGVFLQGRGYDPALAGIVMGLAGFSGLVATAPIGAFVDHTASKRAGLALAVSGIAFGAVLLVAARLLWVAAIAQVIIGVADTSVAPFVAALTLGVVGRRLYGARVSRNEIFNHAGNAANAAVAGVLAYFWGLGFVALAIIVMAAASALLVFRINKNAIDHRIARGGDLEALPIFREIMAETSRANVGLGLVMTTYGAGAALSPIFAGAVAQSFGFRACFVALALLAGAGLAIWLVAARRTGLDPLGVQSRTIPRDDVQAQ
jgi:predicted MFS family arabinose efflux permease